MRVLQLQAACFGQQNGATPSPADVDGWIRSHSYVVIEKFHWAPFA
jgi:hypothetical protein